MSAETSLRPSAWLSLFVAVFALTGLYFLIGGGWLAIIGGS
ncbi:hypothetical protein [Gluconobacter oxydans]|nr:hypothetical protein [Gluconobacter oxydans]